MSGHADTIHATLTRLSVGYPGPEDANKAHAALDALVAENQQQAACIASLEYILFGDVGYRSRDQLDEQASKVMAENQQQAQEIERLRDRAVCSGCGQDVGEGGACHTPDCHDGEMIPASELPLALRESCEKFAEERAEWRFDWEELRAEAKERCAHRSRCFGRYAERGHRMSAGSSAKPWRRWTLTLMRCPPQVTVEAQSFEDAVAVAREQLEAWVPTAQWSGYATGQGTPSEDTG